MGDGSTGASSPPSLGASAVAKQIPAPLLPQFGPAGHVASSERPSLTTQSQTAHQSTGFRALQLALPPHALKSFLHPFVYLSPGQSVRPL